MEKVYLGPTICFLCKQDYYSSYTRRMLHKTLIYTFRSNWADSMHTILWIRWIQPGTPLFRRSFDMDAWNVLPGALGYFPRTTRTSRLHWRRRPPRILEKLPDSFIITRKNLKGAWQGIWINKVSLADTQKFCACFTRTLFSLSYLHDFHTNSNSWSSTSLAPAGIWPSSMKPVNGSNAGKRVKVGGSLRWSAWRVISGSIKYLTDAPFMCQDLVMDCSTCLVNFGKSVWSCLMSSGRSFYPWIVSAYENPAADTGLETCVRRLTMVQSIGCLGVKVGYHGGFWSKSWARRYLLGNSPNLWCRVYLWEILSLSRIFRNPLDSILGALLSHHLNSTIIMIFPTDAQKTNFESTTRNSIQV